MTVSLEKLPTRREIDNELARRSLRKYAQRLVPDYQRADHLDTLIEHLEAVEAGDIKRLMVCMPPRHGKSLHVSQLFPCWYLGRHPEADVGQSGYSHTITLEHSRKARDVFISEAHAEIFPRATHVPGRRSQETVIAERQAAHEWGTKVGGRYRAVGVGGGLTGFGLDLSIIDDPVKNREEAESPVVSQRVWDWYRSTLYTRLSPTGAIVLCMTRWSTNDLASRLLEEMESGEGDQWVVLRMPAIGNTGDALWPGRWPLERLENIRDIVGSYEWSALYQQEPVIRGGNLLATENIEYVLPDEVPDMRQVRFWDLASTKKEVAKDDPDYTVGARIGVTYEGDMPVLWITDGVAVQEEAPERNRRILATAERDGDGVRVAVEAVAGYKDTWSTISGLLKGRRSVYKVAVSGDKVVRADPLLPIFEAGNVRVVRGPWNDLMVHQLSGFPSAGVHDDWVDAISGGYNFLKQPEPAILDRKLLGV